MHPQVMDSTLKYDSMVQMRDVSETSASEDAEMERIRTRYLKRMRIGIFVGIGLIVLLAYVLRP